MASDTEWLSAVFNCKLLDGFFFGIQLVYFERAGCGIVISAFFSFYRKLSSFIDEWIFNRIRNLSKMSLNG